MGVWVGFGVNNLAFSHVTSRLTYCRHYRTRETSPAGITLMEIREIAAFTLT